MMPANPNQSLILSVEDEIENLVRGLLAGGGVLSISRYAFGGARDFKGLLEKYKSQMPAAFLGLNSFSLASLIDNSTPSIDGDLTFSLLVGTNWDLGGTLGKGRAYHYWLFERCSTVLAGRRVVVPGAACVFDRGRVSLFEYDEADNLAVSLLQVVIPVRNWLISEPN